MSILPNKNAFVAAPNGQISLGQMFTTVQSGTHPAYLVLSGLDRNEYTAGATGATGSLSGNGHTASLVNSGGDGRSVGIVFAYDPSTGQYYNAQYGYLDQMTYTASTSLNDVTSLSLYGFNNLNMANAYASNPWALMQVDQTGYLGSVTIATQPGFTGTVPTQATPDLIAAVAQTFVGDAWNINGCWVLASTIAAEAGASLPVQSTAIGVPGVANGEWMVAFNGPAGQRGNWQSMVTTGDIIVIGNGNDGHITTCVSGSGSTAELIDNIAWLGANNQVLNLAHDGSSSDLTISAAHLASAEWAGALTNDVVIYRLDTPVVTETTASASILSGGSLSLQPIFSAADPFGKAVTEYQVYDTASGDSLSVNGVAVGAHTTATADSLVTLSSVSLVAGAATGTDTVEVRAYNGTYWGDWVGLSVTVSGAPARPTLAQQTANQTWLQGSRVSFTLGSGTFADPQHEAMTYAASQANGQALPSWLTFNTATRTFSGTVPSGMQALSLKVTATDTSGLSASETFQAIVPAAAPVVANRTTAQSWTAGKQVLLALPANTFMDPQGEALRYTATQVNGQALPNGLVLNASTGTFTGTAPITPGTLGLKVTATDTSGLSASETFSVNILPSSPTVASPTGNQVWTSGQSMNFVLPKGTFSDPQGSPLTYAAFEISGANQTSWMHFNPGLEAFTGTVPAGATGTIGIKVVATDGYGLSAAETFGLTFSPAGNHMSAIPAAPSMTEMLAFHS